MKKKILYVFALLIMSATLLTGCTITDLFGGLFEKDTLQNGYYKVTTFSVNGESEPESLGQYVKLEGNVMTLLDGKTALVEISGNTITVTYTDGNIQQVFSGIFAKGVITVQQTSGNNVAVMVLTYEPQAELQNGTYVVTTYTLNGTPVPAMLGTSMILSNSAVVSQTGSGTYVIKGSTIVITISSPNQVLTGTISGNSITFFDNANPSQVILMILTLQQ